MELIFWQKDFSGSVLETLDLGPSLMPECLRETALSLNILKYVD